MAWHSRGSHLQMPMPPAKDAPVKLFRSLSLLLLCSLLSAATLSAQDEQSTKPRKKDKNDKAEHGPGILNRLWSKITPAKSVSAPGAPASDAVERRIGNKRLMLSMSIDPQPLSLSEVRLIKVTLQVANATKKLIQLEFPTTQRIEVIIRNPVGKLVEQWSEDRTFANEPGMVSINPGERLEYTVNLSTRDMVAGETYTVEALFPNYEPLRLQRSIKAEK
jgi:hypothetical protein